MSINRISTTNRTSEQSLLSLSNKHPLVPSNVLPSNSLSSWLMILVCVGGWFAVPSHAYVFSKEHAVDAYVPNLILIGAQKAGTTDMADVLRHHSEILMPKRELHFFDLCILRNKGLGDSWTNASLGKTKYRCTKEGYAANFYDSMVEFGNRTVDEKHPMKVIAEKTPLYMFWPHVPERILRVTPNAKLLVLLRDPVERAYSHFRMLCALHSPLCGSSFLDAINIELQSFEHTGRLVDTNSDIPANQQAIISRGIYVEQLQRFYSLFPKEQILVVVAEELWESQDYSRITEFLGLSEPLIRQSEAIPKNSNHAQQHMAVAARQLLRKFFKYPNVMLCNLLISVGERCPSWTTYPEL